VKISRIGMAAKTKKKPALCVGYSSEITETAPLSIAREEFDKSSQTQPWPGVKAFVQSSGTSRVETRIF